jgi:hypothetical protein
MKFIYLGLILLAASCSRQSRVENFEQASVINRTAQTDLIAQLKKNALFESVQTSTIDRDFKVIKSASGENYFVKDNVVVSSSRLPKAGPERTLLHWRYRFKGKTYREAKVEGPADEHTEGLRQLACDSEGMGVVYDPSNEQVTRVFYYEAK